MSTERDHWILAARTATRVSQKLLAELGRIPVSFLVFSDEGKIHHFVADFTDVEEQEATFALISQVGRACYAVGIGCVGEASTTILEQRPEEDRAAFRRRCVAAKAEAQTLPRTPSLATTIVYHDDKGVRQYVLMCCAVEHNANGTVTFGQPILSEDGNAVFGNVTELLPEAPVSGVEAIAASVWLTERGAKEMRRLRVTLIPPETMEMRH